MLPFFPLALFFLSACKILSIILNHGLWTRQLFILIIISYMASCPDGKKNAFENPIDFQRLGSGRGCCSIWFIMMRALRVLAGRGDCTTCNLGQRWYERVSVVEPFCKSCLFWFHYQPILFYSKWNVIFDAHLNPMVIAKLEIIA